VPLADGWVGRRQLERLDEVLARTAGKFRLLVLHHPPVANRHEILRGLRDRGALGRLLARRGAELVVHGHEHRDVRAELPGPHGPIPVIGVGSATYQDPRPERRARYNVYRIEGGRFTVETRVHDAATGRFEPSLEPAPRPV
jgi:3',5'-cyclic AMP phosphodiesterase CpdA